MVCLFLLHNHLFALQQRLLGDVLLENLELAHEGGNHFVGEADLEGFLEVD